MFNLSAKLTTKPLTADRIFKYMSNGISAGVTKTAKEAQAAVVADIQAKFKNRKAWYAQQSPIGIKIKAATAEKPTAEVYTLASFGPLQEKGGRKLPFNSTHLAMPANSGPLANMRSIPAELRPRALIASGKGFIVTSDRGTQMIVMHNYREKGKHSGISIMYILIKKADIKKKEFFFEPIQRVVNRNLARNIDQNVRTQLEKLRQRSG